ncbi:hypothetical protein LPJ61_004512, partial [Coemansia biformis]
MESIFSFVSSSWTEGKRREVACGGQLMPRPTAVSLALEVVELCLSKVRHLFLGKSWAHLIPSVREQVFRTLDAATVGSLTIEEGGECVVFGSPGDGGPHVRLTVLSEQFWVRLML